MEILKNLFYGFPDLWGGGVAHSVMILSLVIALGLCLGKLRVKGVSLGLAWILFIGLIFGHFSLNLDEHLLHFLAQLQRGELQQLDGLLQLRRERKMLRNA